MKTAVARLDVGDAVVANDLRDLRKLPLSCSLAALETELRELRSIAPLRGPGERELLRAGIVDEIAARFSDVDAYKLAASVVDVEEPPAHHTVEEPWPDPVPLSGLPSVPAWDDLLLPNSLRPWLSDAAERIQCPPEYTAVGAMVALSSVVGRGCGMKPKRCDDWVVTPNLWAAVVGPPAAMKSPSLSEATRHLRSLAADEGRQYADRAFDRDVLAARVKAYADRLKSAASNGGEDLAELRADHDKIALESSIASARRHFIVQDPTIEILQEMLRDSPRGVLLNRDELAGWMALLDRSGRENDRAFYLECWDGNAPYSVHRIGRGHIAVEGACVSILGGIQPGPLGAYLRAAMANGAGADGLMQRFQMFVYPDPPLTWRNVDRWPDSPARQRAADVYRRLAASTPESIGADATDGIPFLRFDDAAQELFDGWRSDLHTRLRAGHEHAAMESHLSKYQSLLPSVALLCHLADNGIGPVTLGAAQRAAAWCELLEAHARRVYASATAGQHDGARALLARIRAGRVADGCTVRDVYRHHWAGLGGPGSVEAALDVLSDHHWARAEKVSTPGRPTALVRVHPSLRRNGGTP